MQTKPWPSRYHLMMTVAVVWLASFAAFLKCAHCAEPPHRKLDKARKAGRKAGVERAGIDPSGQASDDLGAAPRGVASRSIGVLGRRARQLSI